ncbi:hypothetical protein J2X54_001178 [Duganella sp. 3397]|nr:hypothetical protein [Duganella sp. 3397]
MQQRDAAPLPGADGSAVGGIQVRGAVAAVEFERVQE